MSITPEAAQALLAALKEMVRDYERAAQASYKLNGKFRPADWRAADPKGFVMCARAREAIFRAEGK